MTLRSRRQFLRLAAGAAALPAVPWVARAQAYPSRPVRIVAGFPAGSPADIVARLMGQWLSERLGQQFVIENRVGAASNIAAETVVRAPADGYALLLATSANASNTTLYEKLSFNFINDIAPVASIARGPQVLVVHPSFSARTVPEFIAYAKANPGKINFASYGNGSTTHLTGELFKMMTGINMTHVPYGNAPPLTGIIGGQVQVLFDGVASSIEHIRAGSLRALAVTSATRLDALPDIPTINDFVPGYEVSAWYGVGVPKNTPSAIIERLNSEINAALVDPRIKARLAELGGTTLLGLPADFGRLIAADTEKWGKVVRAANLKAG
jgi:tripartite-type tricarboxylate transporter receptor subunit TctC